MIGLKNVSTLKYLRMTKLIVMKASLCSDHPHDIDSSGFFNWQHNH